MMKTPLEEINLWPMLFGEPRPVTQRWPVYALVLHNDAINRFAYVVAVLTTVFRYGTARAFWLTLKAHCTGRSAVWAGPLEVAELKAEQVEARGPDPEQLTAGALPLRVTIERLR